MSQIKESLVALFGEFKMQMIFKFKRSTHHLFAWLLDVEFQL